MNSGGNGHSGAGAAGSIPFRNGGSTRAVPGQIETLQINHQSAYNEIGWAKPSGGPDKGRAGPVRARPPNESGRAPTLVP